MIVLTGERRLQVRELASLRVDHHLDDHCQLRRHVPRRQVARRRQDHLVHKNGKKYICYLFRQEWVIN